MWVDMDGNILKYCWRALGFLLNWKLNKIVCSSQLVFLPLIDIFLLVDQQENLAQTFTLYSDICSLSCSGIYRPSRTERSAATRSPAKRKTTSVGGRSPNLNRCLVKPTCLQFLLKSFIASLYADITLQWLIQHSKSRRS